MGHTTFKPGIEEKEWFPEWKRIHFPELEPVVPVPKDEPDPKPAKSKPK